MSVTIPPFTSVTLCSSANGSGLEAVFEIPTHTSTNTPQQLQTYQKTPSLQAAFLSMTETSRRLLPVQFKRRMGSFGHTRSYF